MNIHSLTKKKLSKCDRVLYLHCDHFEPTNTNYSLDQTNQILKTFTGQAIDSAIKPSLFLHLPADIYWKEGKFYLQKLSTYPIVMSYIKQLSDIGCDIQWHIHHEYWTNSSVVKGEWKQILDRGLVKDEETLEFFISETKKIYKECGLPNVDTWGIVHGMWALNASDSLNCNITNELSILRRNGCLADFTFPAGRPWCTPEMTGIFAVTPKNEPKCYNTGTTIARGTKLLQDGTNFVICYPTSNYIVISLDLINSYLDKVGTKSDCYHTVISPENVHMLEDPLDFAQEWILTSCIIDRTLIIKTHAHSLNVEAWKNKEGNIVNNSTLFSVSHKERLQVLQDICQATNVDFRFTTAKEVMNIIKWIDSGEDSKNYEF